MSDDTNKTQSNHTPIQYLIDDLKKNQQSTSGTVSITKEGEPIQISSEAISKEEIEFTETEPIIEDKEVEKYVEVKRDDPEIHPDLKKAGLQSVDTSSLDPKYKVKLPISDEKIIEGLHEPITSSLRWLAEFALFLLKQAHMTLKIIHGKVVRVIKK